MEQADEDEFTRFVQREHSGLFRTVYLFTGDYQLAEDTVQVTFAKIYPRWHRVSQMRSPGSYARRIALNQAKSWWRRRSSTETPFQLIDVPAVAAPHESIADHEAVWAAVLALPQRQRAVIVLRFYEDLSEADTAEILGIAVGTVKSHCHAGCQRLAGLLADPSASITGGLPR